VIEYVIDGQNRRVGKRLNGTLVKRWIYSGQLLPIAELDSLGNVVLRFTGRYIEKGGRKYTIITDNLGSVRLVVDIATREIVQEVEYDEGGNVLLNTNPDFQPFGFAGGLYDSETKLVRFGVRDYDAKAGRWISKDPIGFEGGVPNIFEYCINDPVNFTDPSGLGAWKIPFTSTYFYFEFKTAPGSGGIGIGFESQAAVESKHPKLLELSAEMREKATRVLLRTTARGYQPRIVEALRTSKQQCEKVKAGLSSTMKSKHLTGDAIDVVDRRWGYDDSKPSTQQFFREYGEIGQEQDLEWGGDWKPINRQKGYGWDPGHLQLK
jgi:RHS repeat-associated protein